MIGAFKGLSPLGEGVMDGSTGSPTLFQAMPGETEIRGRLPPHPTLHTQHFKRIPVILSLRSRMTARITPLETVCPNP